MNNGKKSLGLVNGWQEGEVTANGIRIHYYRIGGDKPPLVLAHGITDNGLCWERVAQALQTDFDVIMVDARGHGRSDKPNASYALQDHGTDLSDLIRVLELDKPAVMGHSMGAMSALFVAAHYPGLISRLVLEDPPLLETDPSQDSSHQADLLAFRHLLVTQIAPQPVDQIIQLGKKMNVAWDAAEFPAWAESKKQVAPQAFDLGLIKAGDWRDLIRLVRVPTLLITADTSPRPSGAAIVTQEIAAEAKTLNSQIEVINIPDAGHNIRREQYEAFMSAVRSFLMQ